MMTLEMGKSLAESRGEVNYGGEFLRWFSEEAVRIGGRYTQAPAGNGRILVTKEAVGPVLAITPWNFPLAMGTRKIGPALAAGCTIIVKPAEDTPLTMQLLGQVFADAGLPRRCALDPPDVRRGLHQWTADGRCASAQGHLHRSTGVGKVVGAQCC